MRRSGVWVAIMFGIVSVLGGCFGGEDVNPKSETVPLNEKPIYYTQEGLKGSVHTIKKIDMERGLTKEFVFSKTGVLEEKRASNETRSSVTRLDSLERVVYFEEKMIGSEQASLVMEATFDSQSKTYQITSRSEGAEARVVLTGELNDLGQAIRSEEESGTINREYNEFGGEARVEFVGDKLVELHYNESNRLTQEVIHSWDQDKKDYFLMTKVVYTYNEEGHLMDRTRQMYSVEGALIPELEHQTLYANYQVDSVGNWIERSVTMPKQEAYQEIRSITYY